MRITFILAFCSIVYEFLLSQVLAALLGGTFVRYTTTIALYIFALGLGAFFYERLRHFDKPTSLFRLELLLSAIGSMIPLLAILGESILPFNLAVGFCYALVLLVGFLSGIELPLLMSIEEEKRERGGLLALGVDFLGTFAGCVLFPLMFLPYLGVFHTASVVATLNLLVAFLFLKKLGHPPVAIRLGFAALLICLLSYWTGLHSWLVERVYLG